MPLKSILRPSGSIVRVTPDHYPLITSWYEGHGTRIDNIEDAVSDLGYIADDRVAGFLYVTNSNCAMIEGVIANPHSVPSLRRASLRKLTGFLVDIALMLGYTNIFGISKHPSITKVARELGFKEHSDFKLVTLITGKD